MQKLLNALAQTRTHFELLCDQGFFGPETADEVIDFLNELDICCSATEFCSVCNNAFMDKVDTADEVLEYLFAVLDIESLDQIKEFC